MGDTRFRIRRLQIEADRLSTPLPRISEVWLIAFVPPSHGHSETAN